VVVGREREGVSVCVCMCVCLYVCVCVTAKQEEVRVVWGALVSRIDKIVGLFCKRAL